MQASPLDAQAANIVPGGLPRKKASHYLPDSKPAAEARLIRLFAAIAIPEEIGEGVARRQQGLPGARWRPLASLHLTLRFFGDIAEDKADDIDAELVRISGRPFGLRLSGAGAFANGSDVRAVWAGVGESAELTQLAARCERAARRIGLPAEKRPFRPHVTLAYLAGADPARVAAWVQGHNLLASPAFIVRAFGLYSSWRTHDGAHYRLERSYPFS